MFSLLATTVVPALLPAAGDAIRGVVSKFLGNGGAEPQSVDESIKLMQAEVERMKALAELDKPTGEISKWVADLRASTRYIVVYPIMLNWIAQGMWGSDAAALQISTDLASSAFFFLFGDRVYLKYKKRS